MEDELLHMSQVEKWENERFRFFFFGMCVCGGHGVWMKVGCPCPPVRNDIVTPCHLFSPSVSDFFTQTLKAHISWTDWPIDLIFCMVPSYDLVYWWVKFQDISDGATTGTLYVTFPSNILSPPPPLTKGALHPWPLLHIINRKTMTSCHRSRRTRSRTLAVKCLKIWVHSLPPRERTN